MKLSDAKKAATPKSMGPVPFVKKPKPVNDDEGCMKVKEVIRPKKNTDASPAVGAHLPTESVLDVKHDAPSTKTADTKKSPAESKPKVTKSKKVPVAVSGPCVVFDCDGSDDMMKYEGHVICGAHFKKLCEMRDADPDDHVELDDIFKIRPVAEKPKKKSGKRSDPNSPWGRARALIVEILKTSKSGGLNLNEVLDALIAKGWAIPATNNTVRGTLYAALAKLTADGAIVKTGRGRFGGTL